jgi:hypothetical protein
MLSTQYYIFDLHGALFGEIDANKIFNFDVTANHGSFTFDGKLLIIALYSTKKVIRLIPSSDRRDSNKIDDDEDDYDVEALFETG